MKKVIKKRFTEKDVVEKIKLLRTLIIATFPEAKDEKIDFWFDANKFTLNLIQASISASLYTKIQNSRQLQQILSYRL